VRSVSEVWAGRDATAIIGTGNTDYSRASGRSVLTLATQASLAAIADAGLEPGDIDGIVRCDFDVVTHNDLANSLGLTDLTFWASNGPGGSAPSAMVGQAVGALMSGQAKNVLVFRSMNGRSGFRLGKGRLQGASGPIGGNGTYEEFFVPYGLVSPGQMWAMLARRHMHEYGTTEEQLGAIAVACRARANANLNAQLSDRPLTMQDYRASPMISSPLRLVDYCLETDGACAVVVTTADRSADRPKNPVFISAVTQAVIPDMQGGLASPVLMRPDPMLLPSTQVAAKLYERSGMGPEDIDVAQLYDCFTITVLVQFEDYGFCKPGEGGPFAESGAIELGGSLPINTSGGNLSDGYIHGMSHIVEGARQLRGESTSQVTGAETCLVTSGLPITTSGLILRKG
jgi:acetyl-CoA acetyltransferase